MPIHDWKRVPAGLFHHFHQGWTFEISKALNLGVLPAGYSALVEQRLDGPEPDVIAVENSVGRDTISGGTLVRERPRTMVSQQIVNEELAYARKANRITIRHRLGDVVAVIEIVSPGNKSSRHALQKFVEKSLAWLEAGVHLLIVDLFPPTPRDPQGMHAAIFGELSDEPFVLPEQKPLTLVSYQSAAEITAHVEAVAIGQPLPDMPLFLTRDAYVPTPLESTYMATWDACPAGIRELL